MATSVSLILAIFATLHCNYVIPIVTKLLSCVISWSRVMLKVFCPSLGWARYALALVAKSATPTLLAGKSMRTPCLRSICSLV
jgi:hypothetical protein